MNIKKISPTGGFVVIDDDKEEHELITMAMQDLNLNNPVTSFMDGSEAYEYLRHTRDEIFVILCDINMPRMDGLELKRLIDLTPEIKIKSIPFFFHSSSATTAEVRAAYALGIQGYLQKGNTLQDTRNSLEHIVALWTNVVHPKDLK